MYELCHTLPYMHVDPLPQQEFVMLYNDHYIVHPTKIRSKSFSHATTDIYNHSLEIDLQILSKMDQSQYYDSHPTHCLS